MIAALLPMHLIPTRPARLLSISYYNDPTQTIQHIELLDSQLKELETQMTDLMRFNDSVIITIPGIGYINGGMILGEIGDIHRFSKPKKLLAFTGLDPSVYQSGHTTIPSDIVQVNLSGSFGRCSLTMCLSTSTKRGMVFLYW